MTSPARPTRSCPDFEALAAFSEGRLPREEAEEMLAHIDECDDCMAALEVANETIATRPPLAEQSVPPADRFAQPPVVHLFPRRSWWLAAAAAIGIVAVSLAVFRDRLALPFGQRSSMARLIELAPTSARPVEARLSGGFRWASYRGPMRAEESDADPQRLRLIGAAGEIVAAADRDRSGNAQQAAGVALVVIDKPLAAIDRLRSAVQALPRDAAIWSDLAAAQYAAALRLTRPSFLPEALDSADRALRLEPGLAEARFNRALILERLGLAQQARAAWQHYLDVDPSSPWAAEARARMAKIGSNPPASLRRDLPRLENAAEQGDGRTLAGLLESDPQYARAVSEVEILGQWAEATERGDTAAAERALRAARAIGEALVRTNGESLLREAVRAIDDAPASTRLALADAHATYRRGRIAFSGRKLDAASADLARATTLFAQARSPMALVARYYEASVRFDRNDAAAARRDLQLLLGEADAQPRFIALGAQVRWELALVRMVDGDWSGALPLLEESRAAFQRLDERNHLGFIESLLADALLSVGRPDEAWTARIRAFTLLSADGNGDRLPVSMKAAAQMEMSSGRMANARALLDAAHATGGPTANDAIAADLLTQSALVNTALGDFEAGARSLRQAGLAADRIADPSSKELARTHLEFAGAAALVKSDPARAGEMLTRAIAGYDAGGRLVFLPECYLMRARAALEEGPSGATSAAADLESGIAVLERSRVGDGTSAVVGTGVLDAGNALFEDAIRLSVERNDLARAFAYAERSRTRMPADRNVPTASVRELQQRLGNETAVLQVVVLPEELVAMCVTGTGAEMEKRPISRIAIEQLAARSATADEDRRSLIELYDLIVRPFERTLGTATQLIVVADRPLQAVPFAALYDSVTQRYLVERVAISTAMSASTLQPMPANRRGALLAIALPSGESAAGLPESGGEIAAIAPLYRDAVTIAPASATFAAFRAAAGAADVIHLAGHTANLPEAAGMALVFGRERVTWSTIVTQPLPRAPIVLLAACETLRQHAPAYARTLTLGSAFLAAGASDVIGTLTPIADADARDLFEAIHRHLSAGSAPAEAVRAAQREALRRSAGGWRAIASLTRSIHATQAKERRS